MSKQLLDAALAVVQDFENLDDSIGTVRLSLIESLEEALRANGVRLSPPYEGRL